MLTRRQCKSKPTPVVLVADVKILLDNRRIIDGDPNVHRCSGKALVTNKKFKVAIGRFKRASDRSQLGITTSSQEECSYTEPDCWQSMLHIDAERRGSPTAADSGG